jgi:HTH-type transcriptional regulator/antitoxin HigA
MGTSTHAAHVSLPDDYLDLVKAFPLRALRNDDERMEAIRLLTRLWGRPNGRLSPGERDYADVLGRLVGDYGNRKHPFVRHRHSPLEILRFLMRENGMTTADLGKVLGNKTAASLALNGKRELSKSHMRKLARRFKVEAGLFL